MTWTVPTVAGPGAIPATVRHNPEALAEIIHSVEEGTYCALLGPRLSGKTMLLRYVEETLASARGWHCAYLDLYEMRSSTLHGFFGDLMRLTTQRVRDRTGQSIRMPDTSPTTSAVFRGFLGDAVKELRHDLVLIIEHLEALPSDLVQALLTSLRAAYMDQQTLEYRAIVVVSGALSLTTLTVGESSPFRGIARRVFVGHLTENQSRTLIAEEMEAEGINLTDRALDHLQQATRGDAFLIRALCKRCVEAARKSSSLRVGAATIERILNGFLRDEVHHYAPLQEAVHMIEEDPDLLHCILLLLAHGTVPRSELPLPLSPDVDPLYLTGIVEQVDDGSYRIQNRIYHEFLTQHFHAGHAGHLLAMAGLWDSAIDYLEAGIAEGDVQAQTDLLSATINSIYASEDLGRAAHFLTRGLSAAFGMVEARVWSVQPQESRLRLVGHLGPRANEALWKSPEIPIMADRLEARAYREARALRGREVGRHVWRAIPLQIPGRKPVGVVTVCDDRLGDRFVTQRKRDLLLVGYLNQAARALQAVNDRRRELELAGRMQASLLPSSPPEIPGWQIEATFQPARETSGDFYDFIPLPGGLVGIVIADVADKGMGAALYMALSRTLIRTYAADYPGRPDLVLQTANDRILSETGADLFVTVFLGMLDPTQGTLTYCNAGHHPPYWLRPRDSLATSREEPIQELPGRGIALGVVEEPDWGHSSIHLDPGASLLLYTDGVVDAHNMDQVRFGNEGIIEAAKPNVEQPAWKVREGLLTSLYSFTGEEAQFDDITVLVVRRES